MKEVSIILKRLKSRLTPEEEAIFQEWFQHSIKNREFYEMLIRLKSEGKGAHEIQDLDIKTAWEKIQLKVRREHRVSRVLFLRSKWYKYAAVAVIAFGLSYFFRDNLFDLQNETKPSITNHNDIVPGTDKATLTLEDGSQIELEKGKPIQLRNANSNGEEITYKRGNGKIKEVAFNYLTVPRGGEYFVNLADGTKVWLNSESQLKFPVTFIQGKVREVELVYGEAYFDVSSSIEHDGSLFKVVNNNQEVEVSGTEFNVKAYRDEAHVYTTLVEGEIKIKTQNANQVLRPGQQSKVDINNKNIVVSKVDVNVETSWKNGIFSFNDKQLKDIMKVISRWYDVDVIFVNKELKDIAFIGQLGKNQELEDVLITLKTLSVIEEYEIDNKTIIFK